MRCKQARWQISLDLDRRLSAEQRTALEAHLLSCAACRQSRAELAAAWDLLGSAVAPQAPDDWRAVAARLASSPRGLRAWLSDLWGEAPGRFATAAVLASFMAAGAVGGAWLARGVLPQPGSSAGPGVSLEAVAMSEAFGDVPGAAWLASGGRVAP